MNMENFLLNFNKAVGSGGVTLSSSSRELQCENLTKGEDFCKTILSKYEIKILKIERFFIIKWSLWSI